jgi:hypothetical protein
MGVDFDLSDELMLNLAFSELRLEENLKKMVSNIDT